MKIQINSKIQFTNFKLILLREKKFKKLEIENWLLFEIWDLVFGILGQIANLSHKGTTQSAHDLRIIRNPHPSTKLFLQ